MIESDKTTIEALTRCRAAFDDAMQAIAAIEAEAAEVGNLTRKRLEELEDEVVRLQSERQEMLAMGLRNPGDDHIVGLADNRSRTDAVKTELDDAGVVNKLREGDHEARLSAAKTQARVAYAALKKSIEVERRRLADAAIIAIKDSGLALMPFVLAYSGRTLNGIWHECKPLSARRAEIPEELLLPIYPLNLR